MPPPDEIVREHMFPKQFFYIGKSSSTAASEVENRTYVRHLFAPVSPLLLETSANLLRLLRRACSERPC